MHQITSFYKKTGKHALMRSRQRNLSDWHKTLKSFTYANVEVQKNSQSVQLTHLIDYDSVLISDETKLREFVVYIDPVSGFRL